MAKSHYSATPRLRSSHGRVKIGKKNVRTRKEVHIKQEKSLYRGSLKQRRGFFFFIFEIDMKLQSVDYREPECRAWQADERADLSKGSSGRGHDNSVDKGRDKSLQRRKRDESGSHEPLSGANLPPTQTHRVEKHSRDELNETKALSGVSCSLFSESMACSRTRTLWVFEGRSLAPDRHKPNHQSYTARLSNQRLGTKNIDSAYIAECPRSRYIEYNNSLNAESVNSSRGLLNYTFVATNPDSSLDNPDKAPGRTGPTECLKQHSPIRKGPVAHGVGLNRISNPKSLLNTVRKVWPEMKRCCALMSAFSKVWEMTPE